MSNNTTDLKYPGGITLEQVSISGIDVSRFFVEINLFEDIFSPTMSGKMLLSDSIEFCSALYIQGGEDVMIKFRTTSFDDSALIQKHFKIYRLDSRVPLETKTVYIIHFISTFAYNDNKIKISRLFNNSVLSSIKEILEKDLGVDIDAPHTSLFIQPNSGDSETIRFISPNWSPLKVISKLTTLAVDNSVTLYGSDGSPCGGMAGYLFYESNKGLNYFSYPQLVERTPADNMTYFYDSNPLRNAEGVDLPRHYQTIIEITINKQFDMLERLGTGIYNSSVVDFDILHKRVKNYNYDYIASIDGMPIMNKYSLNSTGETSKGPIIPHVSFDGSFGSSKGQDQVPFKDISVEAVKSRVALGLMNVINIEILVNGRTDMEVGDVIFLVMPASKGMNIGSNPVDVILTGKYIITAICHRIASLADDKPVHTMRLQLSSDSTNDGRG